MARIATHCFVTLLMALVAVAAHAQPLPSTTVRVTITDKGGTLEGELLGRDSSALIIHRFDPPETMHIAISTIERAEYLRVRGRDRVGTVKTAVLIGAAVGTVVGYATASKSGDCIAYCSPVVFAAVGSGVGAVLGLYVGLPIAAATGDRWERFDPADVRVSVIALPTGRSVGLALRWSP